MVAEGAVGPMNAPRRAGLPGSTARSLAGALSDTLHHAQVNFLDALYVSSLNEASREGKSPPDIPDLTAAW